MNRIWKNYIEAKNSGQWNWPDTPFEITTITEVTFTVLKIMQASLWGVHITWWGYEATFEFCDINSIKPMDKAGNYLKEEPKP